MRVIPTRINGFLDYGVALLLIASPWTLGFADGGAEQWVPVALGTFVIVYSLATDYELSVARMLSMPAHLGLDMGGWRGTRLVSVAVRLRRRGLGATPHLRHPGDRREPAVAPNSGRDRQKSLGSRVVLDRAFDQFIEFSEP